MAFQHGRFTKITVGGDDISTWTNTSEMTRGSADHNNTTYGKNSEVHGGGLLNGEFTCGGIYDNTVTTGTHPVLNPLVGTVVEIVRMVEGAGAGKPVQTFDGLLTSYVETAPVADMVTWSATFVVSDDVADDTQEA
ncbi:hypothetical protein E1211_15230 [Micromonospora sp. 15K316]|uniref:hypothetical protein n=1 Tax=unclassified Micromonospora TaxID=2617518 RepID=UPI00104B1788|nr:MULTISPECIES: hypothetical protein [unclassified Micromonospora]TDB71803.1 hypothetical protein E1165_21995 [Micromonospora sp. KC723]TDC35658.1 hypothetical protein E1211_15230 [Micromonospora sp. 15K316]